MSDEELIIMAQRGDYESFEAAVMKLKDRAYKIAYSYLGDPTNSMDAVCDAVEKALINIRKLKEPKFFSTWFIRIVINECKAQLKKRRDTIQLAESLFEDRTGTPTKDEVLDLEQTLESLPPMERLLVKMKYYLGYSFEEIADVTEMPLGTVKSKIYGTLRKLRVQLEVR